MKASQAGSFIQSSSSMMIPKNTDQTAKIKSHFNTLTIADAAKLVAEVIDYKGKLVFDISRPDGTPRKLLDSSKLIGMGWRARTSLREGLELTYSKFLADTYRAQ